MSRRARTNTQESTQSPQLLEPSEWIEKLQGCIPLQVVQLENGKFSVAQNRNDQIRNDQNIQIEEDQSDIENAAASARADSPDSNNI